MRVSAGIAHERLLQFGVVPEVFVSSVDDMDLSKPCYEAGAPGVVSTALVTDVDDDDDDDDEEDTVQAERLVSVKGRQRWELPSTVPQPVLSRRGRQLELAKATVQAAITETIPAIIGSSGVPVSYTHLTLPTKRIV